MIFGFFLLLVGLVATTPWIDNGAGPNPCYVTDQAARQVHGPCKPEMTRGRTR